MTTVFGIKFLRGAAAAAAAQTDVVSEIIDIKDHDRVYAVAALGDVSDGSVLEFALEFGDKSDGSDFAAHVDSDGVAVKATHTADASDANSKLLAVHHNRPFRRYCRARLKRGTADAVVDGITFMLTDAKRITNTRPTDDALDAVESFG
ncbi:MAG: hypothetical protein ACF8MJ_10195 [Phycisphaerales bacterium JB050]